MECLTVLGCEKCGKISSSSALLSCSHVVCRPCLDSAQQKTVQPPARVCPVCLQSDDPCEDETHRGNLNLCMATVSEVFGDRTHFEETKNCCVCNMRSIVSLATYKCLDCGDTLCSTCHDGHQASSATFAHSVVTIEDIQKGNVKVKVSKRFLCSVSEHMGKKYEYYCKTCKALLCPLCLIFGHLDHNVNPLSEAAAACRHEIDELNATLKKGLQKSCTSDTFLHRHKNTVDTTEQATLCTVRQKTQFLIDRIRHQEEELVKEIKHLCDRQRSDISTQEAKMKQAQQTGNKLWTWSRFVSQEAVDAELMLVSENIKTCLEDNFILKTKDDIAKFASHVQCPVYTLIENYPPTLPFSLSESFIEPMSTRLPDVVKTNSPPDQTQPEKAEIQKPTRTEAESTREKESDLEGSKSTVARSSKNCINDISIPAAQKPVDVTFGFFDAGAGDVAAPALSEKKENPVETEDEDEYAEDVYKVTESLSVVGEYGRSLSQTDSKPAQADLIKNVGAEAESLPPSKLVKTVVIPSPIDCDVIPFHEFPMSAGFGRQPDLSLIKNKRACTNALCLMKEKMITLKRPSKDTNDLIFVGMCCVGVDKLVLLDEGNKTVRLIHSSGRFDNKNHPNQLKESFSPHAVIACEGSVIYVSGTTVYIAGSGLNLKNQFTLDVPKPDTATCPTLPLCRYTNSSFIIANLPGNKFRVYSLLGKMMEERSLPVEGPVVAVSIYKDDRFLLSCWCPQGAVHLVKITTGHKIKTFRPPYKQWQPEGTCVDSLLNVYVANAKGKQIHVFGGDGSQIYALSADNAPRCLLMNPANIMTVSGAGPSLQTYKCTYFKK